MSRMQNQTTKCLKQSSLLPSFTRFGNFMPPIWRWHRLLMKYLCFFFRIVSYSVPRTGHSEVKEFDNDEIYSDKQRRSNLLNGKVFGRLWEKLTQLFYSPSSKIISKSLITNPIHCNIFFGKCMFRYYSSPVIPNSYAKTEWVGPSFKASHWLFSRLNLSVLL